MSELHVQRSPSHGELVSCDIAYSRSPHHFEGFGVVPVLVEAVTFSVAQDPTVMA